MNITFFSRLFYPHVGGIERHVEEISIRLREKGHNITILTTKHDKYLKNKEYYRGIKIVRFQQPKIKFTGLLITWIWLINNISLIMRSDIIHIHDVFIWYWPFKIIFPNKNVYTTFHGQWGQYPLPIMDTIQKRIGSWLSKGNISIGKYIPLNYKYDANIINYGATNIAKGNSEKVNKRIIYIGRLDTELTLNHFFTVLKELDGYKVEFCGDGEMREECEKYGKVHGFVNPNPFYAKAKCCFASGYLTIMEAMAYKCLVIVVYDNPLKKDYYEMTPFAKYIVIGKNSEDLLKKFKFYERNPKEAQKKINKGYNWVKHQTWDKMVDDYLKLWGINEKNTKSA